MQIRNACLVGARPVIGISVKMVGYVMIAGKKKAPMMKRLERVEEEQLHGLIVGIAGTTRAWHGASNSGNGSARSAKIGAKMDLNGYLCFKDRLPDWNSPVTTVKGSSREVGPFLK